MACACARSWSFLSHGRGNCPCGHTADLVERRIVEVDAEIQQLMTLTINLVHLQRDNEACRTSTVDAWSSQIASSLRGVDAP